MAKTTLLNSIINYYPDSRKELLVLICISAFIFFIGLQITPGITPDSIRTYLPTSESIFNNNIIWYLSTNSYGTTIIPPMYMICTTVFMNLGFEVVHASGLVSLISFAILPIPLYYLGKQIGGTLTGSLTVIICIAMKPFWEYGTAIMTDMLFILFIYLSLLFFYKYLNDYKISYLFLFSFFLIMANWTRWLGLALLITYLSIMILILLQKKIKFGNFFYFIIVTFPLISLYYIRNFILLGDIYSSGKMPFSIPNILINIGMIGMNIIWDFMGFNPYMTFNQALMDYYFNFFQNFLPLDYLSLLHDFSIGDIQKISILIGIILLLLFLVLTLTNIRKIITPFIKDILKKNKWVLIFILFTIFYLGIFLYTESTNHLTLIDTRYLLPIYPLIIITGIKVLLKISKVSLEDRRNSKVILYLLLLIFIFWQVIGTTMYLSKVYQGRDFSDPTLMNGPAYQWMKSNDNEMDKIIINDGLRSYIWDKSLNINLIQMPIRDYPINNYLMEQKNGTYLVITPVIGTKGPYRWNDLKPYIVNSSRYMKILDKNEDRIYQIIG